MLTRARAKEINRRLDMENAEQIIRPPTESEESSQSEEVNNQLGMADVFEETTQMNIAPEVIRGGGQAQMIPESGMERMFIMLQKMEENNQKQREEDKKEREEENNRRKKELQKMEENNQKRHEEENNRRKEENDKNREMLREELRIFREESIKIQEETKRELQETKRELRAEMQQTKEEIRAEMNAIKGDSIKTQSELKENKEAIDNLKSEVVENRREIAINTKNLSDNLNRINHDLRKEIRLNKEETAEVKKCQEEMGKKIQRIEEEKNKKIEEIAEGQEQLTRRINEVEGRPTNRGASIDHYKDLTFTGNECYPMEFLKELKEIRQLYYPEGEIRWIARYLSEEAMTWFRIIKYEINCFSEFEDLFIEKYWGAHVQENVRDRLEYGKYRPNGGLTAVQYMQKHILQCRQLMPPISDHHLIKKLARHYGREIEVASFTRGIKEIPQFENLLRDYAKIISHNRYSGEDQRQHPVVKSESKDKDSRQQEKAEGKGKPFDRNNYKPKRFYNPVNDKAEPGPSNASKNV